MILSESYFKQPDVLYLSENLLGKYLISQIDGGEMTGGIIAETEAYRAPEDRASHAYGNKMTKRNSVMFASGGVAYVYLCYGMHNLFNIVTNLEGIPHAILIRAIIPVIGMETIKKRGVIISKEDSFIEGPGNVTKALGIARQHNALPLYLGKTIWLEDCGNTIATENIIKAPRIGVAYAKEDALLPWRFRLSFKRVLKM